LSNFREAIKLIHKKDKLSIGRIESSIGYCYIRLGDTELASKYLNSAIRNV